MDMFQAMNVMNNPQDYISQQAVNQAMQRMIQEHPAEWQATQKKFGGMPRNDMIKALRKEYKRQGQDLDAVASQYNIRLN